MKKICVILMLTMLMLSTVITVSAHSGGTDDAGGHYNHSTGEYHYHHGLSAHDHYDMDGDWDKDCPYRYNEDTDYTPWYRRSVCIFGILFGVPVILFFLWRFVKRLLDKRK